MTVCYRDPVDTFCPTGMLHNGAMKRTIKQRKQRDFHSPVPRCQA